mmetsp:Transcript_83059/g.201304  ORF Transcript_83059/g.201304 Transcript_83059/m.201304 type:complete len:221 (-) Transcript_83059:69-731(-)
MICRPLARSRGGRLLPRWRPYSEGQRWWPAGALPHVRRWWPAGSAGPSASPSSATSSSTTCRPSTSPSLVSLSTTPRRPSTSPSPASPSTPSGPSASPSLASSSTAPSGPSTSPSLASPASTPRRPSTSPPSPRRPAVSPPGAPPFFSGPVAEDWLRAGLKVSVRLHGLRCEALNGAVGQMTGWDQSRLRCCVKLPDRTALIKPENLDLLSDSETESAED